MKIDFFEVKKYDHYVRTDDGECRPTDNQLDYMNWYIKENNINIDDIISILVGRNCFTVFYKNHEE